MSIPSVLGRTPWATRGAGAKLSGPHSNPVINSTSVQFDPVADADHSLEYNSYSGSDIMVTLYIPPSDKQSIRDAGAGGAGGEGVIKLAAELQTITISSARSVHPVRRLGEIAPANYTRGGRTVAGTMIFTTLFRDAFAEAYQRAYDESETDLSNFFVDQIPRFNMQLAAANEYGYMANSVLTNIHLTNFGTTLSVDDLYTEATYCVDDQTQVLTSRGWKYYNEVITGDKMLTIDPETQQINWENHESLHTFDYDDDLVHWKNSRGVDAMTTPNHRWLTTSFSRKQTLGSNTRFEETQDICGILRKVVFAGGDSCCFADYPVISDEMVELIGWAVTEGTVVYTSAGNPYGVTISQSESYNPEYVNKLRALRKHFSSETCTATEIKSNRKIDPGQLDFYFGKGIAKELLNLIPGRSLTPELLCLLTHDQAVLLQETMINGDGHIRDSGATIFTQNPGRNAGMFQMLCSMLGQRTSKKQRCNRVVTDTTIYQSDLVSGHHLKNNRVHYKGVVWCPKTPSGTWMARRNGNTFWTGNTYVAQNFYPFVEDPIRMHRWLTDFNYTKGVSDLVKEKILHRRILDNSPTGPDNLIATNEEDILNSVAGTLDQRYPKKGLWS